MKTPRFGPMLLAACLFLVILLMPAKELLPLVNGQSVKLASTSLNPKVFQGILLQKKMLENPRYLPIYGSSELSRFVKYHPAKVYKARPDQFQPFLVGRGGSQCLVHFLNLAALGGNLRDKKLVFILSPQWFEPKGIDEQHFDPNFSTLQAYMLALNSGLSPELKKRAARRLLQFQVVRKDKILAASLEGFAHPQDSAARTKAALLEPVMKTYVKILQRKDLMTSISGIPGKKLSIPKKTLNLSEQTLLNKAERTGEEHTLSNPFGILDSYYSQHIAGKLGQLKNYKAGQTYTHSLEYGDLQMVLDLLKEEHAHALFVSVPVNGYWYDYAGFSEQDREQYYKKVSKQIKSAGFQVADYSAHEYEKYFLVDTMHIGWKGWVYIDQDINRFYRTTQQ